MIYLQETLNENFVKLVDENDIKLLGFTKQELTDPLATQRNLITNQPEDNNFVKWLKSTSGNTDGFTDWEQAQNWLEYYQSDNDIDDLIMKMI